MILSPVSGVVLSVEKEVTYQNLKGGVLVEILNDYDSKDLHGIYAPINAWITRIVHEIVSPGGEYQIGHAESANTERTIIFLSGDVEMFFSLSVLDSRYVTNYISIIKYPRYVHQGQLIGEIVGGGSFNKIYLPPSTDTKEITYLNVTKDTRLKGGETRIAQWNLKESIVEVSTNINNTNSNRKNGTITTPVSGQVSEWGRAYYKGSRGGVLHGYYIQILIDVEDPHEVYAPIDGYIKDIQFIEGKFHEKVFEVEVLKTGKAIISLEGDVEMHFTLEVGKPRYVTNRIRIDKKIGDYVRQGELIGEILLGSLAYVYFPPPSESMGITYRNFDDNPYLVGGKTVIAQWYFRKGVEF